MLVDSAEVSIPAGATVNVFLGRPIEFIGAPSVASLAITGEAEFMTMTWTINVAGVQHVPIASGSTINAAPAGGVGPREDEDTVITNVPMPAGSRNSLAVFNGSAAAAPIRYRAVIQP
jgi:hypothetical protein